MSAEGEGVGKGPQTPSEDEVGRKWDRCFSDLIVKTGAGAGVGIVFSLALFKRKLWPIALGTGIGIGYASSNCQHDFRRVATVHMKPIKESGATSNSKITVATDSTSPAADATPDSSSSKQDPSK